MKKYQALFLSLVCIFSLFSCAKPQPEEAFHTFQPAVFSEYLDNENFVPELSQSEFKSQMNKYRYEGTSLPAFTQGYFHDGFNGGGFTAYGKYAGYDINYTSKEDEGFATYSNSFYTKAPLEGLPLPCGITFDDTLDTVLKKLNINIDPKNDFVSDDGDQGTMTLQKSENSSLTLTDCSLLPDESGKTLYGFELNYTEKYHITQQSEKETNVTRSITLLFTDENYKLGNFAVAVVETYKLG